MDNGERCDSKQTCYNIKSYGYLRVGKPSLKTIMMDMGRIASKYVLSSCKPPDNSKRRIQYRERKQNYGGYKKTITGAACAGIINCEAAY